MTSQTASPETTYWADLALGKLSRVFGVDKAAAIYSEILAEIGCTTLTGPADMRAFGEALARRDGFLAAVGISLQTQALLHETRKS